MLQLTRLALASVIVSTLIACGGETSATTDSQEAAATSAKTTSAGMENFIEVRPGLYRGGHPDAASLDHLKSLGVTRIVNLEIGDFLEAFPWQISAELEQASARGISELRFPMSAFEPAQSDRFDTQMDQILKVVKSASPHDPVYVHCKHGQDRTGLVIGLDRVLNQGWQPQIAHDEMVKIGFHTSFLGLQEYFENKAHWED
jgi:tyrosine-protein phosphatase SIW14